MAKRGRPPTFDRDEALRSALELFWAHGYEGATLERLQAAMGGITPPSFYHAFGSKERLFRETVELYLDMVGAPTVRALEEGGTAREGLKAMLRKTTELISRRGKPRGCLLVLGATNCAPANRTAQDYLQAIRGRAPKVIKQRLDRAVAEGELPASASTKDIAAFYATVLHGLGVRAGDGAPRRELLAAVSGAMAAWDGFVAPLRDPKFGPGRLEGRSRDEVN